MAFETLLYEAEVEALRFIQTAASEGVHAAIRDRDGPFADESQAAPEDLSRRDHRIRVNRLSPA